jgi:iron complex transport system ATP-binding protein
VTTGASLVLDRVGFTAGDKLLLRNISLDIATDGITMILGPNGAGKSTLLRIAAGRMPPTAGRVLYDGQPVSRIAAPALARRRAFLSQHVEIAAAVSVETVVTMGRYPHFARTPARSDHAAVDRAFALMGVEHLRHRLYPTLSGGEQQRVQLARVLAQVSTDDPAPAARTLFLDEPLAGLDIQHQLQLLDVLRGLTAERCSIMMSVHDLNLALDHGDRIILLRDGRIVEMRERPVTLDDATVRRVFDVGATMLSDAQGNRALRFHR